MPMVNGKKFAYTPKGMAAAKKAADDYYKDEQGNYLLDEGGNRIKKPMSGSTKAERSRTKLRGAAKDRKIARQNAIREKLRNPKIPASPTR